jgi:hypothetical protein
MDFTSITDIQASGFEGMVSIAEMQQSQCRQVPDQPGIYMVIRLPPTEPAFLAASIGGHFKGRNPTLPLESLISQWVSDSPVIYIGRSSQSLQRRLRRFMDFGLGKPVGHWGGRCVWQLADSEQFLLAWKATSAREAPLAEAKLIQEFKAAYGRRPFANLRD